LKDPVGCQHSSFSHALAPEVLDFGLVTALSIGMDSRPGLTRQNAVQGTPAFIAPEQR
jgi:hypothetical protein